MFRLVLTKLGTPGPRLSLNLAHVVSQPIFDIPRLVEAARHQLFDSILGGGSPERTTGSVLPPSFEMRYTFHGYGKTLAFGHIIFSQASKTFIELFEGGFPPAT
jgi:hypothetical protein